MGWRGTRKWLLKSISSVNKFEESKKTSITYGIYERSLKFLIFTLISYFDINYRIGLVEKWTLKT